MMKRSLLVLLAFLLLMACTPTVPKQYIQPDKMEDILYDYFVSQGIAQEERGGFLCDEQIILHLLLHGVIADSAVLR